MLNVVVGGCRATVGGLHLGHLYGTFDGLDSIASDLQVYFVISDCCDRGLKVAAGSTRDIARGVLGVSPVGVSVVRESRLRSSLAKLADYIERSLSFRRLREVHS